MINYRQIFNPSYTTLGLITIIVLIVLLIITNKNTATTIRQISHTALIASSICLILSVFIKLIISIIIPSNYQIIIEVISTNLTSNIISTSLTIATGSIIALILTKILQKTQPAIK